MVNFRFIATFAAATLVFLAGVFFGQYSSYYTMSEFRQTQNKMLYDIAGYELAFQILPQKEICNTSFKEFIKERAELGQTLASLEEKFGSDDEEVISLKERYHIYQIQEYLFFRSLKEECGTNNTLILQFYSKNCDLCMAQGTTLDALYAKDKSVNIYAIDYDIDNPALRALKSYYKVSSTPSLVINGKTYTGFLELSELEKTIYG